MSKRFVPRLYWSHPNFFIAYLTMFLFWGIQGFLSFYYPERFNAPALDLVRQVATTQTWGSVFAVTAVLMLVGAYRDFNVFGRLALVIGMSCCISRGILIEASAHNPGSGILVWGAIAIWHFTMVSEPDTNPASRRG